MSMSVQWQGTDSDVPNSFHSGPIVHGHRTCYNCCQTRRFQGLPDLKACARCLRVTYCVSHNCALIVGNIISHTQQSSECQKSHWKKHKADCAQSAKHRSDIEGPLKEANIFPHAYADFTKWCDYHETSIKNATVAALNLRQNPLAHRNALLSINIAYKQDWENYPSHMRFDLMYMGLVHRDPAQNREDVIDMLVQAAVRALDNPINAQYLAVGKAEMGSEFYGNGQFMILGAFQLPSGSFEELWVDKWFSISKDGAEAEVNPQWETLLDDYFEKGNRMRACCRKLAISRNEQICCCDELEHR